MQILGLEVSLELGAALAALAGIVTAIGAVVQYYISERWKRAEFSVAQIRRLSEDETFAFCCRAIDWGTGPLIVPGKYRDLFSPRATVVSHNWILMAKALRPKLHPEWSDDVTQAQFLLYRYAFDEFFDFIDGLLLYKTAKVIKKEDLSPLDYYLRQITFPLYWFDSYKAEVLDEQGAPLESERFFGDFISTFYPERLSPWIAAHRKSTSERF